MEKVLKKVQDNRFQTWKQVKAWLMANRRKLLQSRKKSSYQTGSLFDDLMPVLNAAEMHINGKKFVDSVTSTIGTNKLKNAFNHRLDSDRLPEDITQLFLSPVLLKLCQNCIRRATRAKNRNSSDSNGNDSAQSDSDDDSDYRSVTSATPIPSVETEHNSSIISDPFEAAGRSPNRPLRPVSQLAEDQEAEDPDLCPTSNPKSQGRIELDKYGVDVERCNERFIREESSLFLRQPSRLLDASSMHASGRVQGQVAASTCAHQELERLVSLVPAVRPFSDFRTPAAEVASDIDPKPESVNIPQAKRLLHRDERGSEVRIGNSNSTTATNHPQRHQQKENMNNTNNAPRKKAAKRRRKQSVAPNVPPKPQPSSQSINIGAPKLGVVGRPTPAILIEENRRQGLKFAKPVVPTQIPSREPLSKKTTPARPKRVHAQGEIAPPAFYHPTANVNINTAMPAPQVLALQPSTSLQPVANNRAVQTSKPDNPLACDSSLHRESVLSDQLSGASFLSMEEWCRRAKPQQQAAIPEGSTPRGIAIDNNNKKRQRLETPADWLTPSPKRTRVDVTACHSQANSVPSNKPRDTRQYNQTSSRKRRRGNANSKSSLPLTPLSDRKGRQDNIQIDTGSRPNKPSRPYGQNNTWQQKPWHGPCGPGSSTGFRSQTAPPGAVGEERHTSNKPIPSIEEIDTRVAATHQTPRHRYRKSKSRKPSGGKAPYGREFGYNNGKDVHSERTTSFEPKANTQQTRSWQRGAAGEKREDEGIGRENISVIRLWLQSLVAVINRVTLV